MIRSRLLLFEVLYKYRFVTSGNAFGAGTTVFIDIEAPQIRNLLPHATELTLFTLGEGMTANVSWGIFLASAYSRTFEGTAPTQLGGTITGPGPSSTRHSPFTTLTSMNLESRLLLGIGNNGGVTTFQGGVASATLGVLTVGM